MILRFGYYLSFYMLLVWCTHMSLMGMDSIDHPLCMPDIYNHIITFCDASRDEVIKDWLRWRAVCTVWRTILTYEYMAKRLDLLNATQTDAEREVALLNMINDNQHCRARVLCSIYATIVKERAFQEVFEYANFVPRDHCSLVRRGQWLRLLLKFTQDPNLIQVRKKEDNTRSLSLLEYVIHHGKLSWYIPEIAHCLDVLLAHKVKTQQDGLLHDAADASTLYVVSRLLEQPLSPSTDMGSVLQKILARYLTGAYHCDLDYQIIDRDPVVVRQLLHRGAKVSEVTMQAVASVGNFKVLDLLLACNSSENIVRSIVPMLINRWSGTVDHQACVNRCIISAPQVISELRFDQRDVYKDFKGASLLHKCVWHNSIEVMKQLLDRRVIDVDLVDGKGNTALVYALWWNLPEALECLLARGASMQLAVKGMFFVGTSAVSDRGKAIHILCSERQFAGESSGKAVLALIDGAKHIPKMRRFAMKQIAKYNNIELLKIIMNLRPDYASLQDSDGNTILHHAASYSKDAMVAYLLALNDSNPSIANNAGKRYNQLQEYYTQLSSRLHIPTWQELKKKRE